MAFCVDCKHVRRGGHLGPECADGEDTSLLDYVAVAPRVRRSVCKDKNEGGKCKSFEPVSGTRSLLRRVTGLVGL